MASPSKRYTGFFDYIGIGPDPLQTLVKTRLAWSWSYIATDAERDGAAARSRRDSGAELRSALVGSTAVTHALDALYGELRNHVPQDVRDAWGRSRTPRRSQILETIKFIAGTQRPSWGSDFAWLFDDRRDPAVHADAEARHPEPHPAGGHSSRERALYTVEAITRAVDLLASVLDALGASTKLHHHEAKEYASLSACITAERLSGPPT